MPGRNRYAKAQFLHHGALYLEPLVTQRSQGTGGPRELPHQHPGPRFGKSLRVAIEHVEPDRTLVAKGHWQRLLQVRAARHRRIAVAPRKPGQYVAQRPDISLDNVQAIAQLQRNRRVHDVLGCRAPVHVAA